MVPKELASAAYGLFMAIPRRRIDDEVAEGPDGYEPARRLVLTYLNTPAEHLSPGFCAEYLHAQLVQAAAVTHPGAHPDVAFHLVGVGARDVATTAVFAAEGAGELGRLTAELDRIRAASGDEDFDERADDRKPPGYVAMAARAGEIMRTVEAMMMVDVMNRYGFHGPAELFEADEAAFAARVREGYYVLFPDKRKD